jgi:hypothetical protein
VAGPYASLAQSLPTYLAWRRAEASWHTACAQYTRAYQAYARYDTPQTHDRLSRAIRALTTANERLTAARDAQLAAVLAARRASGSLP